MAMQDNSGAAGRAGEPGAGGAGSELPRLLPQFIIIGAMKSGTTTLYRYLDLHPAVEMSRDKETDFFLTDKNRARGLDWYAAQFTSEARVRGEASPNYTKRRDFPGVPERISAVLPDARLIYVVRDPVDRAVSQYRHSYILGDLDGDLNGFAGSHEYEHILDASRYAAQLDAYRALFPDDAILVLDFDELVRAPQAVMDRICAHIGVPAAPFSELGAQNDSRELSRIPAPVLRFAQSPLGRRIAGLVPRAGRDRVRRGLARGPARTPPEFPRELLARIGDELRPDAARFREMTGLPFAGWSV